MWTHARRQREDVLAFAYRTFSFIKHHYTYEYPTENRTSTQDTVRQAVKRRLRAGFQRSLPG